jgi:nucleotide-binding universal stress UspA family protein
MDGMAPSTLALRHVLFPYDFSSQCRHATPFVRALAETFAARVTLLSVVPPVFETVPPEMGGPAVRAGDESADWKRNLRCRLDRALVDELAGLDVTRVADSGDPALRIAAFAVDHAVDLVMMPTHGLGLFRSLLVGSVTSKVLHDVTCPVWTAAHADTQTAPVMPRTILCAVDGTPAGIALMRYASGFSARVGATLTLVHVVEPVSDVLELAAERRLQQSADEAARDALAVALTSAGINAPLRVLHGAIVSTTTAEARRVNADLVIIGRGAVAEPFGRLRTHAFGIVQGSPCPVISV